MLKSLILILIVVSAIFVIVSAQGGQMILFQPTTQKSFISHYNYQDLTIEGVNINHYNNFPNNRTVLYCHGNAGNISHRRYIIEICNKMKLNLVLFDYQGYGKSRGTPFQCSLNRDAQIVYDYLRKQTSEIMVWGESMGGSPAVYLAENNEVMCLVLLSTFSSLDGILSDYNTKSWNFLRNIHEWLFDRFDNCKRLKNVKCACIIVHSTSDEIVPFNSAEKLFSSIRHNKKSLVKIGGSHADPNIDSGVMDSILEYLKTSDFTAVPDFNIQTSGNKFRLS